MARRLRWPPARPIRHSVRFVFFSIHLSYPHQIFSEEADVQVHGVPDQSRRRMTGRAAALAYYRQMYEQGKVMRLTEIAA